MKNRLLHFFVTLAAMLGVVGVAQVNGGGPNGGGGGGGSGTVSSVGLTSSTLAITGSPITTSGTFTADVSTTGIASCASKQFVPFFGSSGLLACSSRLQYQGDVGGTTLTVQGGGSTPAFYATGNTGASAPIATFTDASASVTAVNLNADGVMDLFRMAPVARGGVSQSGCSVSGGAGGDGAGKFTSGTTGTCTVTIQMHMASNNGWTCAAQDLTHPVTFTQTATDTTHCTVSGATTSGDVVVYTAYGF